MAKNKQRRTSYYANGREHAKTLNAFFRVNNYRGKRWHNSGEYLRGLTDGLKIELKTKDPARLAQILWYVDRLPSTVKGHVVSKTGIKIDKWGMATYNGSGQGINLISGTSWQKPSLLERAKAYIKYLFGRY